MSHCEECFQTNGFHREFCSEKEQKPVFPVTNEQLKEMYKDFKPDDGRIKKPIEIPIVPEDAVVPQFVTKDSGLRQVFESGMVRDVQTDKPRYDLIGWGWKLIKRWAELVGRGAVKYGELNFEKACTEEEMLRFRASALRHTIQWYMGETDEDHAAAVCFNIAGYEAVKEKLRAER